MFSRLSVGTKFQYGGALDDVTATGKKMNHTIYLQWIHNVRGSVKSGRNTQITPPVSASLVKISHWSSSYNTIEHNTTLKRRFSSRK